MPKKRLDVNWDRAIVTEDLKPALKRFRIYLEYIGLRESTVEMYVFRVGKYLEFTRTDMLSAEDLTKFRDKLHEAKLSRSTINNYCFAIKKYYETLDQSIDFPFTKLLKIMRHTPSKSRNHRCPMEKFVY